MMQLIDACPRYSIDEILELPDVKERVDLYRQQTEVFVASCGAAAPSGGAWSSSTCAPRHGPEPP